MNNQTKLVSMSVILLSDAPEHTSAQVRDVVARIGAAMDFSANTQASAYAELCERIQISD